MRGRMVKIGAILLLMAAPHATLAQQRARVADHDSTLTFRTVPTDRGRFDPDHRVMRSATWRDAADRPRSATEFFREDGASFGIRTPNDLELVRDRVRSRSRHQTWRQTYAGLPVYGGSVGINLDGRGRVTMVSSSFRPIDAAESGFDASPTVSERDAGRLALAEVAGDGGSVADARLVVLPEDEPRLAWDLLIYPATEPAEFRVLVDARSGRVIRAFNMAVRSARDGKPARPDDGSDGSIHAARAPGSSQAPGSGRAIGDDRGAHDRRDPGGSRIVRASYGSISPAAISARSGKGAMRVDGSGFVYIPGPLMSSGSMYTPPFVDNNDATNPSLDAERVEVILRDITFSTERGGYVLTGPHVDIINQTYGGSVEFD
ncbi:MAG: hypothetical protein HKN17_09580, partial [Rhodothermales bacterium]|nr:hypothetical protein [Rhodothermales bacterium]